ncbi:MAG: translation elongation factor Ts [Thermodesulfobacteriota bacterium]
MEITSKMVKELRDKTNAGMMDCKKALTETGGNLEKAVDHLRQKGLAVAAKRSDRETSEGTIQAYIHSDGKLGVIVEVGCETDFVAKTDSFIEFARNIAMHIAASNPVSVTREGIPEDMIAREKEIFVQQALDSGKPEHIVEKIVSGKLDKYYSEITLMEQNYVKNPDITIEDLLNELVASLGEKITIKRFTRFQVGEV